MKTLIFKTVTAITIFIIAYFSSNAQTSIVADTIKNICIIEGESVESSDILFQICDSTIIQLSAENGNVRINSNLEIPNGFIQTDSIRARVIHVGDSSIIIGNQGVGSTNSIYTTNGTLQIQSRPTNNFNTIPPPQG